MTVKIRLKEVRLSRQLSQNKLAQRVGMTLQNLQRIEYGDAKSIPLETLDKLCQALNCQPGDLLVWIPSNDGNQANLELEELTELKPSSKTIEDKPLRRHKHTSSFFTVVPKVPKSA